MQSHFVSDIELVSITIVVYILTSTIVSVLYILTPAIVSVVYILSEIKFYRIPSDFARCATGEPAASCDQAAPIAAVLCLRPDATH